MSSVNENVITALRLAGTNVNQPKEVAQRFISWLDSLAKGNIMITDKDEAAKRIEDLLDLVHVPSEQPESDDLDSGTDE